MAGWSHLNPSKPPILRDTDIQAPLCSVVFVCFLRADGPVHPEHINLGRNIRGVSYQEGPASQVVVSGITASINLGESLISEPAA